jgi:hypothetical protein
MSHLIKSNCCSSEQCFFFVLPGPPLHRDYQKRLVLKPWVHRAGEIPEDVSWKSHLKQPPLFVEISNLTTTSSFPSLDLLRPSIRHMSVATSVPGKRWVRTVSVATGDPALGLSSRQDRPQTLVSSRYCAIGQKQIPGSELNLVYVVAWQNSKLLHAPHTLVRFECCHRWARLCSDCCIARRELPAGMVVIASRPFALSQTFCPYAKTKRVLSTAIA